jgi:hypothetical protein
VFNVLVLRPLVQSSSTRKRARSWIRLHLKSGCRALQKTRIKKRNHFCGNKCNGFRSIGVPICTVCICMHPASPYRRYCILEKLHQALKHLAISIRISGQVSRHPPMVLNKRQPSGKMKTTPSSIDTVYCLWTAKVFSIWGISRQLEGRNRASDPVTSE